MCQAAKLGAVGGPERGGGAATFKLAQRGSRLEARRRRVVEIKPPCASTAAAAAPDIQRPATLLGGKRNVHPGGKGLGTAPAGL